MAQCRKSGSRAEKILSQKSFPKQLKMVKRKKLYEHVRIQPAINHKKHCIANFSSFAVIVDVTDILQTSKHNFQFCAKHVRPCHAEEKYLSNDKKDFRAFCNFDFDVCLIFLLRYYGSCYRLQHVEKGKERNTEEDKNDMPKKSKHVKKEKHVKEKQTCQKRETCRKSKERRKKTEKKRAKIARCLRKKVKTNFILFVSTLEKAFFALGGL